MIVGYYILPYPAEQCNNAGKIRGKNAAVFFVHIRYAAGGVSESDEWSAFNFAEKSSLCQPVIVQNTDFVPSQLTIFFVFCIISV